MRWFLTILAVLCNNLAFGQSYWNPKADALLLAWYRLDTTSWTDSISGSNGTGVNSPTTTADAQRGAAALYVPGVGPRKYVQTVNSALFNSKTVLSMVLWGRINVHNADYIACFLSERSLDDTKQLCIQEYPTYITHQTRIYTSTGSSNNDYIPTGWTSNRWYHLVNIWDASKFGGRPVLYRDGRFTQYGAAIGGSIVQDDYFTIGTDRYETYWRTLNGYVDDVMIFARLLSANEISQIYFGTWLKEHSGWNNLSRAILCQTRATMGD